MATVGYGDVVPRTFFGKLTGACCAIMGILSMSFPGTVGNGNMSRLYSLVPVFVSHFNYLYNLEKCECKLRPEELLYNNNET